MTPLNTLAGETSGGDAFRASHMIPLLRSNKAWTRRPLTRVKTRTVTSRKYMEVSTMKNSRFYLFVALFVIISLAVIPGCSTVITPGAALVVPVVPTTPEVITPPVKAAVSGAPDLAVTKVWLDGVMINYSIKNVDPWTPRPTNSYIYVNDMMPAMGQESYVDCSNPDRKERYTSPTTSGRTMYLSTPVQGPIRRLYQAAPQQ